MPQVVFISYLEKLLKTSLKKVYENVISRFDKVSQMVSTKLMSVDKLK